jgi:aryl-alcohol dehydrogenase-like predicted oxidoreductase
LEESLVPTCAQLCIAVVAYSPNPRGLLAQKVDATPDDWRSTIPRFSNDNLARNAKLQDVLQDMGKKYEATPAQDLGELL